MSGGWLERTRLARFVAGAGLGAVAAASLAWSGLWQLAIPALVLGLVPLAVLVALGGRLPARAAAGPTEGSIRRAASRGKR